jgi:hypothetical protein
MPSRLTRGIPGLCCGCGRDSDASCLCLSCSPSAESTPATMVAHAAWILLEHIICVFCFFHSLFLLVTPPRSGLTIKKTSLGAIQALALYTAVLSWLSSSSRKDSGLYGRSWFSLYFPVLFAFICARFLHTIVPSASFPTMPSTVNLVSSLSAKENIPIRHWLTWCFYLCSFSQQPLSSGRWRLVVLTLPVALPRQLNIAVTYSPVLGSTQDYLSSLGYCQDFPSVSIALIVNSIPWCLHVAHHPSVVLDSKVRLFFFF